MNNDEGEGRGGGLNLEGSGLIYLFPLKSGAYMRGGWGGGGLGA